MRKNKGSYGYFAYRKKIQMLKCLFVLAGIIILLLIGYFATHSKKNLMTVVAIVSSLPLANAAVVLFTALPYRSRPAEEYETVKELAGDGLLSTELLLTRGSGKSFLIDYAYVHPKGLFLYTTDGALKEEEVIAHIQGIMVNHELYPKIKVYKNLKKYQLCIKDLEPVNRGNCEEVLLKIEGVLHAISI